MAPAYLTLATPANGQVEVRRSRFRAHVHPITSEPAARELVADVREQHPDAGHHCWAMTLGTDPVTTRSTDDGEPSGTAGAPILEVLRGAELGDVVAVVSRWFGGTLLGSGGLARAYGDAVRAALDDAPLARRVLTQEFTVSLAHAECGRVEHELRARGVQVGDTVYGDRAVVQMVAPPHDRDGLERSLAQITGGTAELRPGALAWRTLAL